MTLRLLSPLAVLVLLASACGEPAPAPPGTWSWPPVDRVQRYVLEATAASHSDPAALSGPTTDLADATPLTGAVTVRGTLEVVPLRTDGRSSLTQAIRVLDGVVTVRLGAHGAAAHDLAAELAEWSFVGSDAQGRAETIAVPGGRSSAAVGLVAALASRLQLVRPAGPVPADGAWSTEEASPEGRFEVRYALTRVEREGRWVLEKRRSAYRPPEPKPGEPRSPVFATPRGALRAELGPDGAVASVDADETVALSVGGRSLGVTRTTLRLRRIASEPLSAELADALAAARAAAGAPRDLDGLADDDLDAAARDQAVAGLSAGELLRRLARAAEGEPTAEELTALSRAVEALASRSPEVAVVVADAARGWDAESPVLAVTAAALARAGSAPAQDALIDLLVAREAESSAVLAVLPALGRTAAPAERTEATLRRLAGSSEPRVASTAHLALGNLARRLVRSEPERAHAVGRWAADALARALAIASDGAEAAHWLRVLGNAGPAAPAEAIEAALTDPRAAVRAAACWASRFVPGPAVDARLVAALGSDPAAEVRLSAARALALRAPREATALAADEVSRSDPDDAVRRAAAVLARAAARP